MFKGQRFTYHYQLSVYARGKFLVLLYFVSRHDHLMEWTLLVTKRVISNESDDMVQRDVYHCTVTILILCLWQCMTEWLGHCFTIHGSRIRLLWPGMRRSVKETFLMV